jgi:hypothetical protein
MPLFYLGKALKLLGESSSNLGMPLPNLGKRKI